MDWCRPLQLREGGPRVRLLVNTMPHDPLLLASPEVGSLELVGRFPQSRHSEEFVCLGGGEEHACQEAGKHARAGCSYFHCAQ
jgi:hypothetical protein